MPLPLWGAGTSSAAITEELVNRGHKVTVISAPMDRCSGDGSYKGASVIRATGFARPYFVGATAKERWDVGERWSESTFLKTSSRLEDAGATGWTILSNRSFAVTGWINGKSLAAQGIVGSVGYYIRPRR